MSSGQPANVESVQLTIALVGWIVTLVVAIAGWLLGAFRSWKDRRHAFQLEVTEHARREIAPHFVAYQQWVGRLASDLSGLSIIRLAHENLVFSRQYVYDAWQRSADELASTLSESSRALAMFQTLEDYEAVFPQTRDVRLQLIGLHQELTDFAYEALSQLRSSMPLGYVDMPTPIPLSWLSTVDDAQSAYFDMQALVEDLRIGIQNAALSRMFRTAVPARAPLDRTVPRIIAEGRVWHIENELPRLPNWQ